MFDFFKQIFKKENWSISKELVIKNTFSFLFMMAFIISFIKIFGEENTLVGVCIYVGLMVFPECDTGMKLSSMLTIIFIVFVGSIFASDFNVHAPLWVAFVVNFLFVMLVMLMTSEPTYLKLNVIMLLLFLFCQSVPVSGSKFDLRVIGTLIGTFIVLLYTYYSWKNRGYGKGDGRGLIDQIKAGWKYKNVCIRMALSVSLAILITGYFATKKPLWISLVVLSLTQFSTEDMISRMKHRVIGTIVGVVFFVVVFTYIVPIKYGVVIILLLGYLGYYFNDYKHKQFINSVSAINASLVLFNPSSAIVSRFEGLIMGIGIVLLLFVVEVGFGFFFGDKPENLI